MDKTLDMHKWSLRTFLGWAQERDLHYPEEITRPILESYQRYLYRNRKADGKPMAVATQRGRLGAVQRFFAWLCRTHQLSANPASDLELPRKPPRGLPKGLSLEHVRAVLNLPDVTETRSASVTAPSSKPFTRPGCAAASLCGSISATWTPPRRRST